MKRPKRRASLHSTGKVQEADLLARAHDLYDDVELAIVKHEGPCVLFCPFKAGERAVRKVHAKRADEKALARASKGGNLFARAYAATLLIGRAEKLPVVASLRLPGNIVVSYGQRGKAKPLHLAGLQHFDDRALRLLLVADAVRKRDLHVWSTDDGLVCTGKRSAPPGAFLREEMDIIDATEDSAGAWSCAHKSAPGDRLVLTWPAADARLTLCSACAADENTLRKLLLHFATRDPTNALVPSVRLAPFERLAGAGEPLDPHFAPDDADMKAYRDGAISDREFLARARGAALAALRRMTERRYVAESRDFGDDATAFVDALKPTPAERRALLAALATADGPVVVERASVARTLAEIWKRAGRDALLAAAKENAAVADALYREDAAPETLPALIARAASEGEHAAVSAALPRYARLPPAASVADAIARAFRALGRDEAARVALTKTQEGRERGVALAFLRALGRADGNDWRFGPIDREVADALAADARRLLECDADAYHDALVELARRAGATEEIRRAGP
ncbi:MAG: hypothetical protein ACYDCK_14480 [Thermoplasmatota archaeon]